MRTITVFAILALAASAWATFLPDVTKGGEVDCSKYMRKGLPTVCSRQYKPLCGSDRNDYSNECMFCKKQRENRFQLRKLHDGRCIHCTHYSEMCTMEYNPHCGSNGVVYGNRCSFCNAVVKSRGKLYLAKYGRCDSPYAQGS